MKDPFKSRSSNLSGPATDLFPVVPSDVTDLPSVGLGLFVETGGTVSLVTQAGHTRTITLAGNSFLPVGTRRVNATGTTALGIHAFLLD